MGKLRGRRKLILIWSLLLLLALGGLFQRYCDDAGEAYCEARLALGLTYLYWFVGLAVLAGGGIIARKWLLQDVSDAGDFKCSPQKFHGKVISLCGKVERVLENSLAESLKRKVTDVVRTIINDDNRAGRYVHQRFLISSPALRHGCYLLVLHNIEFGKIAVRKGKWVEVKGEYLHQPLMQRTLWGRKRTFYGRLHFTHEPKGFAKVLSKKPRERLSDRSL